MKIFEQRHDLLKQFHRFTVTATEVHSKCTVSVLTPSHFTTVMYFYHPWEDPTTTNTWEANVDCRCVEDEDGVFAICRSTNQH